jgi:APA family basic amino acid/polyamine antiporter
LSTNEGAVTTGAGAASEPDGLVRGLGLFDSVMIVAGTMIGSAVFIVAADITRNVGSSGWLLVVWVVTGILALVGALCYGELATMMPRAGGQYVYLSEAYSPLVGFLYGWTLFAVVQTGSLAAITIAFARFLGVLVPWVSPEGWIVRPIALSHSYAVSLTTQQLVAILLILLLTYLNTRGLRLGRLIQNSFTLAKTAALAGVIMLGLVVASDRSVIAANFADMWTPRNVVPIRPDLPWLGAVTAAAGGAGLFIAVGVSLVGAVAAADAWFAITYVAGEVRNPRRNIPLALIIGTSGVVGLYLLANLSYLFVLPLEAIQNAPDDRVATLALERMFGPSGAVVMAVAILISTFGCANAYALAGARVYWAMARDGLFFRATARLNDRHVPAVALTLQGLWASVLVLPRTRIYGSDGRPAIDPATGEQLLGNLYSNLLDYVVFAALLFYIVTMGAVFVLRRKRPGLPRPYRAVGYPIVPALYMLAVGVLAVVLLLYRTSITWPGLLIVLAGVPVYWMRRARPGATGPVPPRET